MPNLRVRLREYTLPELTVYNDLIEMTSNLRERLREYTLPVLTKR